MEWNMWGHVSLVGPEWSLPAVTRHHHNMVISLLLVMAICQSQWDVEDSPSCSLGMSVPNTENESVV